MFTVLKYIKYFLFFAPFSLIWGAELNDAQSWWNLTATGAIPKIGLESKAQYWLEGQQRFGDYSSRLTQSLFRPGLGYSLNQSISLWLGYAWIYTDIPFARIPFSERRLWQQVLWVKKRHNVTLSSRTRLEQRFLDNNPITSWRVREMLKIVAPIPNKSKLSIVSSNELFWLTNNLLGQNNKGFDQNRFFIGWGYKYNSKIHTEIGYLNQFIHRRAASNLLAHNLYTTLIATI